jgi:hypothetical protein
MKRREPEGPSLYHGGVRKLKRGDLILPPSRSGAPSCADFGAEQVCRRDRVYATTEIEAARLFALAYYGGPGDLYQVELLGDPEPDPDYDGPGESLAAPMARVHRVLDRRVDTLFGMSRDEVFRQMKEVK